MLNESNISEKQASTVPVKSEFADKTHHYKVRRPGLAELDSKFFINRQIQDEKNEVVQDLISSVNVMKQSALVSLTNDFDGKRTRNMFATLACV